MSIPRELLWSEITDWCFSLFGDKDVQPRRIISFDRVLLCHFSRTLSALEEYLVSHDEGLWLSVWQEGAAQLIGRLPSLIVGMRNINILDAALDFSADGHSAVFLFCDQPVPDQAAYTRLGPLRQIVEVWCVKFCAELFGKGPSSISVQAKGDVLLIHFISNDVITSKFQQYDCSARLATRLYYRNGILQLMDNLGPLLENVFGLAIERYFSAVSCNGGHLVLELIFEEQIQDMRQGKGKPEAAESQLLARQGG